MSKVALTYRDYAALPDDGRRYQILDGELFVSRRRTRATRSSACASRRNCTCMSKHIGWV